MGNFLILTVTCILAASFVNVMEVNGDDLSSSSMASPSPAPDCQYLFSKMSTCLDYLVPESNETRPSYLCCYDLIGIVYRYPQCSCYAIRKSIRMELDLNYTRLFTLDSVCQLNIPPVDCRISLPISPPNNDYLQGSSPPPPPNKNIASSPNVPTSVSPTIAPAAPSPVNPPPEPKAPSKTAPAPAMAVETPSPPPQAPNSGSQSASPTPESVQPRLPPVPPTPAPTNTLQGHYSDEVLAPAPVPVPAPAPAPTVVLHSGATSVAVACDTILLSLLVAAFSYAFA